VSATAKNSVAGNDHKSLVALVLIDVINHFEFPDGKKLLRNALPIAARVARLKQRAREVGIPTIYVNDNFGQWRSNASHLLDYCMRSGAPSREFVEPLRPDEKDYLVLKPKHSAFYQTPLDTLLDELGSRTLILGGLATNSCVLCTTHDANMRDLRIFVPADCSAARTPAEHRQAIKHIELIQNVNVSPSTSLRLDRLTKAG
jgi:nicotinamidase-related amidase